MRPRHEQKNSWPEYERSVLDKLGWLEKQVEKQADRIWKLELAFAAFAGAITLFEILVRLKIILP